MKKNCLYAILAIGLMASCSKDSYDGASDPDGTSGADAMPIMISAAAPPTVTVGGNTRSVGSVGADGTGMATNTWNGQTLTMFAFPKDIGTEKTVITGDNTKCPFFGKLATAAKGTDGGTITWADKNVVYFPRNGAYDFFGYHSDGAVTGSPAYTTVDGENVYAADYTIDGSQDLMYAKAVLTDVQKGLLKDDANKAFSSYTARREIQPEMTFNHLLTRLTFTLKAATKTGSSTELSPGSDEVYVRSIKVYSKTTGKFVVISNNKTATPLVWNAVERKDYPSLLLKERKADGTMQKLNSGQTSEKDLYVKTGGVYTYNDKSSLTGKELQYLGGYPASLEGTSVGESLLVAPDTEYVIEVEVMQYYNGDKKLIAPPADADWYKENVDPRYYKFTRTIKATDVVPAAATFSASSSYNVTISMYGLQVVDVKANLGKWVNGGNINWTPEDDDFLNNNK